MAGSLQPFWILGKEFLITMADHCRTRTGGYDHRPGGFLKYLDRALRQGDGMLAHSGIESWLTAASLTGRESDFNPSALQYPDHCFANFWVKGIENTSDH